MRIINIVEQLSGVITNITSFGIFEEQLSSEVVEVAEEFFKNQILKNENFENKDEEDILFNAIENGHYEQENGNYYTIDIIWSDI